MQEIWKPIIGYENLYEVSNLGNVRSLDHIVKAKCNSSRLVKGHLLSPILAKNGYLVVTLGHKHIEYIHRLVAIHFVDNPNNLNVVNHKDECKTNNVYTNLEWTDLISNFQYGTARKRQASKIIGVFNTKCSKPIEAFNDEGEIVYVFPSAAEAHRNGFDFRNVSAVCLGKRQYYKGLHWRFASNA